MVVGAEHAESASPAPMQRRAGQAPLVDVAERLDHAAAASNAASASSPKRTNVTLSMPGRRASSSAVTRSAIRRRALEREAVDPGRDGRKRDGATAELGGERERGRGGTTRAARPRPLPPPCQTGPTVWMTWRAGQVARGGGLRLSGLAAAEQLGTHPESQARRRDGWRRRLPPPPSSDVLAALTIASVGVRRDVTLHDADAIRGARSYHPGSVTST